LTRLSIVLLALLGGVAAARAQAPAATASAPVVSKTTSHLAFTATLAPGFLTPGARLQLAFDIVPKKGMHVYAPGGDNRPVAIKMAPHASLQLHEAVYPKPTVYRFKPTNDEWLVYDAPFRLVQDIIVGDAGALKAELGSASRLVLKGELQYQACDESVCYLPVSVPVEWNLPVKR
jgi:DsbC/DsbD-like thiol-disulfide interchange protein